MALIKPSFGNSCGVVSQQSPLAFQLSDAQQKTITQISASFRVPANIGLNDIPFVQGCVVVFRRGVDQFQFSTNLLQITQTLNLEYLKFFNSYEGFSEQIYITANKGEFLSVLMFPAFTDDNVTVPNDTLFGSLNVFGAYANDKQLFDIGLERRAFS